MNGLLPGQFAQTIGEPRTRGESPQRFWKAIVEARGRRRDDLVAIDEEAYAEPLRTALFLYRRDPPKHRPLVLSALGPSSSTKIWRNLAAAARDAWTASDGTLLGALAYRADEARQRQGRPHPAGPVSGRSDSRRAVASDAESAQGEVGAPEAATPPAGSADREDEELETNLILDDDVADEHGSPGENPPPGQPTQRPRPAPRLPAIALALTKRFQIALNFEGGCVEAERYVRTALGYLRCLPATFVVPHDLVLPEAEAARSAGEPSSAEDRSWPLLRDLWLRHSGAWHAAPTAADEVGKLPCRFLAFFVERHRASAPRKSPPAAQRPENPFTQLAAGHAEEPPEEAALDLSLAPGEEALVEPASGPPLSGEGETPERSDSRGRSARPLPWGLDALRSTSFGGRYAGAGSVWRRSWAAVRNAWDTFRGWLSRH